MEQCITENRCPINMSVESKKNERLTWKFFISVRQWINTGSPESQCHHRNLPKEDDSLLLNLVLGFMLISVCIPGWPMLPGDGSVVQALVYLGS